MLLGLENCAARRPASLDGARFGLLMNRASVDQQLRLSCDVLSEAYPHQLVALFTPQHGLWGDAQANMIESPHDHHQGLDVPIYSLYSETRRPTQAMMAGMDCLVVDLQDVGTRVYTFVWSLLECLQACAEADVSVLVLDRPNPIGGNIVEGPLLGDQPERRLRILVGGKEHLVLHVPEQKREIARRVQGHLDDARAVPSRVEPPVMSAPGEHLEPELVPTPSPRAGHRRAEWARLSPSALLAL